MPQSMGYHLPIMQPKLLLEPHAPVTLRADGVHCMCKPETYTELKGHHQSLEPSEASGPDMHVPHHERSLGSDSNMHQLVRIPI